MIGLCGPFPVAKMKQINLICLRTTIAFGALPPRHKPEYSTNINAVWWKSFAVPRRCVHDNRLTLNIGNCNQYLAYASSPTLQTGPHSHTHTHSLWNVQIKYRYIGTVNESENAFHCLFRCHLLDFIRWRVVK